MSNTGIKVTYRRHPTSAFDVVYRKATHWTVTNDRDLIVRDGTDKILAQFAHGMWAGVDLVDNVKNQ
jgi:hypothetical protein